MSCITGLLGRLLILFVIIKSQFGGVTADLQLRGQSHIFDLKDLLIVSDATFTEVLEKLRNIVEYREEKRCSVDDDVVLEKNMVDVISKSFSSITRNIFMIEELLQSFTGHFKDTPCTENPSVNCTSDQWECRSGECISKDLYCNGEANCPDESDESSNCTEFSPTPESKCHDNHFICKTDGRCIAGWWACDGVKDCEDGSDEENCHVTTCSSEQFQCVSLKFCIDKSWRCNGYSDCLDGSDEENCPPDGEGQLSYSTSTTIPYAITDITNVTTIAMEMCDNGAFHCRMKHRVICLPLAWICDDIIDCDDGADETSCSSPLAEVDLSFSHEAGMGDPFSPSGENGTEHANKDSEPPENVPTLGFTIAESNTHSREKAFNLENINPRTSLTAKIDNAVLLDSNPTAFPPKDVKQIFFDMMNTAPPSGGNLVDSEDPYNVQHNSVAHQGSKSGPWRAGNKIWTSIPIMNISSGESFSSGNSENETSLLATIREIYGNSAMQDIMSLNVSSNMTNQTLLFSYDGMQGNFTSNMSSLLGNHSIEDGDSLQEASYLFKIQNAISDFVGRLPVQSNSTSIDTEKTQNNNSDIHHLSRRQRFNMTVVWRRNPCNRTQFACTNETRCIPKAWHCDGKSDCKDGDDEKDCPVREPKLLDLGLDEIPETEPEEYPDTEDFPPPTLSEYSVTYPASYHEENTTAATLPLTETSERTLLLSQESSPVPDTRTESSISINSIASIQRIVQCDKGGFKCKADGICIPKDLLCDGRSDCPDSSDELNCKVNCRKDEFHCAMDYKCIPQSWRCDGEKDCSRGQDERGCPKVGCKQPSWFKCAESSSHCINPTWLCDGDKDCPDGSDESNCTIYVAAPTSAQPRVFYDYTNYTAPASNSAQSTSVPPRPKSSKLNLQPQEHGSTTTPCEKHEPGFFRCANGEKCINVSAICNGIPDCLDESDEGKGCDMQQNGFLLVSLGKILQEFSLDVRRSSKVHREVHGSIVGISYDPVHREVYWTVISRTHGGVYRKAIGSQAAPELFLSSKTRLEGLAVDWFGRNLYVSDSMNTRIRVCSLATADCTTLIQNVAGPRSLQLDLEERNIYWTDSETPLIEVAGMDGKGRAQVVASRLGWANGIALDFDLRRIYWIDGKYDTVEYTTMKGEHRQIVRNTSSVFPYAVAVWEDRIYWTDMLRKQALTCSKWNCSNPQLFTSTAPSIPGGMSLYHPTLFKDATNFCIGHSCSHICLLSRSSNDSYTCACPDTMTLMEDRKTCV